MSSRADYDRRDAAIVKHILLYGIGLHPIISKLFFDGKQCGHILRKLDDQKGLLKMLRRALPGGLSLAVPRPRACTLYKAPKERAERPPLGAAALDQAIAVAWFCVTDVVRRHKVEHAEIVESLGKSAPPANVVHVVTEELGYPCLLRVYCATAGPTAAVRNLRTHAEAAVADPELAKWISAGDYGFAVLAPNAESLLSVRRAVERSGLHEQVVTVYGVGPTAEMLASEIRKKK